MFPSIDRCYFLLSSLIYTNSNTDPYKKLQPIANDSHSYYKHLPSVFGLNFLHIYLTTNIYKLPLGSKFFIQFVVGRFTRVSVHSFLLIIHFGSSLLLQDNMWTLFEEQPM